MPVTDRDLRFTLLARVLSEQETIFFPLIVTVEEDQTALFSATVAGLETKIFASGASEDEAADEAVDLFRDIVDTAIEQDLPLTRVLGKVTFKKVQIAPDGAYNLFQTLQGIVDSAVKKTEHWNQINATENFIPLAASVTA